MAAHFSRDVRETWIKEAGEICYLNLAQARRQTLIELREDLWSHVNLCSYLPHRLKRTEHVVIFCDTSSLMSSALACVAASSLLIMHVGGEGGTHQHPGVLSHSLTARHHAKMQNCLSVTAVHQRSRSYRESEDHQGKSNQRRLTRPVEQSWINTWKKKKPTADEVLGDLRHRLEKTLRFIWLPQTYHHLYPLRALGRMVHSGTPRLQEVGVSKTSVELLQTWSFS